MALKLYRDGREPFFAGFPEGLLSEDLPLLNRWQQSAERKMRREAAFAIRFTWVNRHNTNVRRDLLRKLRVHAWNVLRALDELGLGFYPDQPIPHSAWWNIREADRLYAQIHGEVLADAVRRQNKAQSDKARRPRAIIENDDGEKLTLKAVIERLARSTEYKGYTSRELWPQFIAVLDKMGCAPRETCTHKRKPRTWCIYYHNGRAEKSLMFSTFQGYVTDSQKNLSD